MSQIIKTTDISTIRPMFAQGASENIKRYGQLKKLFEENREYEVLAEPVPYKLMGTTGNYVTVGQGTKSWSASFNTARRVA